MRAGVTYDTYLPEADKQAAVKLEAHRERARLTQRGASAAARPDP